MPTASQFFTLENLEDHFHISFLRIIQKKLENFVQEVFKKTFSNKKNVDPHDKKEKLPRKWSCTPRPCPQNRKKCKYFLCSRIENILFFVFISKINLFIILVIYHIQLQTNVMHFDKKKWIQSCNFYRLTSHNIQKNSQNINSPQFQVNYTIKFILIRIL